MVAVINANILQSNRVEIKKIIDRGRDIIV